MRENAKIAFNGYGSNISGALTLRGRNTRVTGLSKITLSDTASIRNNEGPGIYSAEKVVTGETYYITEIITLSDHASIENNLYASSVMSGSDLYLKDQAFIGKARNTVSVDHCLAMNGGLYLDGTAVIEGITWIKNYKKPITLTKPVDSTAEEGRYKLRIGENFVGEIVVKPDGVNVSDASEQIQYFKKEFGEGLAGNKNLLGFSPNIILEGENNVYIAGSGNDANNGITLSTPVRTFKRAKELLQGAGYFSAGANILVVNQVPVLAGDENWGFGPGGTVTNSKTNETWTPILKRYRTGNGELQGMIYVNGGFQSNSAQEVVISYLTIDGGGDNNAARPAGDKAMIYCLTSMGKTTKLTLGEGAVIMD